MKYLICLLIIIFIYYEATPQIGVWERNLYGEKYRISNISCYDSLNCFCDSELHGSVEKVGFIIKKTSDGGKNWIPTLIDTFDFFENIGRKIRKSIDIKSHTDGTIIVILNDGEIASSKDYGETWSFDTIINHETDKITFTELYLKDSEIGFITIKESPLRYMKSNAVFNEWTLIDMKEEYKWHYIHDIEIISNDKYFFLTSDENGSYILRTSDDGLKWDKNKVDNYMFDFDFLSENEGWAVLETPVPGTNFNKQVIVKTTDGGYSWEKQRDTNALDYGFQKIEMINSEKGIAAGYMGKIYRTNDGGENWSKDSIITSVEVLPILDLEIISDHLGFISSGNEGLFSLNKIVSSAKNEIKGNGKPYIFPNPVNLLKTNEIMLQFPERTAIAKLEIYNVIGEIIKEYKLKDMERFSNFLIQLPEQISQGIYFIKIIKSNSIDSIKFIVTG